ncbi:NAD(P)/FAD-dependent oxidoreductase [Burkholderia multivorans]|uniref:NAD(P)/FAD-dependent oxidoreductase n=1 Tax=Burkholderia multivorans TaxID=87883 RepID=UPI00027802E0|nr:FAD-dependent oxidoreductase [Burkholderia multivorans]EJO51925.1 FAD dependent oxidoreductase [Burkholderia multivorans CF2]MBJ9654337.1 FAD-binding oxidoreductase [Burkholderia multivorans]MBR8046452.1 FAD-binding oxidoreductase [Burkholderia multivorans]MBU9470239.1 FAD-binding oxidoreductase [Burkholderia multivorans]MCA8335397.1 FAD-binding oxidoreductase [Burkholderia multivorans]
MNVRSFDVVVAGGGLVGMALAWGLARLGERVAVCDGDDIAFRAARGNFGLVWVQGKGGRCLPYARWSRESSERWGAFAAQLQRETGVDCGFERPGGIELFEHAADMNEAIALLESLRRQDAALAYEALDPAELRRRIPAASPALAGALWSPNDGHANPLYTLRALLQAFVQGGGVYLPRHDVVEIRPRAGRFEVDTRDVRLDAARVVLAAGLDNARLAPMVDMAAPISPLRGQIMVTERLAPFLAYPTLVVRQTQEGSVLLGDSAEDVGFDDGQTRPAMADIARRARTAFPALAHARIVRAWGALRIMTPDGLPVYEASRTHPGAYLAICHSGVTLAASHADLVAPWIAGRAAPAELSAFTTARFAAPKEARHV